jgi:DNA-binding response OmpR family regulator
MLLRFSGIEVRAAATARQALSLNQGERFDLYVLDAGLPDFDGFELCRRLRDRNSQTPIVILSGAADEVEKKRSIDAGANAYVIKSDVDSLFGSIVQFLLYAENHAARVSALTERTVSPSPFHFELLRDSAVELRKCLCKLTQCLAPKTMTAPGIVEGNEACSV